MHRTVLKHLTGLLGLALVWVSSCPSASGTQSVSLSWNPNTATNVAGYALYVGNTSGNYASRIDVGTNTTSTITGLTNGETFYFVATAYDASDVESPPSNEAQFVAPSNNPPVLNPIANYYVPVYADLLIPNSATDSIPSTKLTYSLVAGAPTNMVINPTNGLIEWIIPLNFAGTTNSVTVQVSDSSVPPATASQTFNIVVSNYVQVGFGSSVVALGQTSSVPLTFNSSVGVTNVSFVLDVPGNRMTNLSVTTLVPGTVTQTTNGAAHSTVTFKAAAGQVLQGPLTIGQVNYKAIAGLPSCFAPLHVSAINAVQSNGVVVPTTIVGAGQAVLVGSQALTQTLVGTNGQRNMLIYGPAGTNYQLQSRIGVSGAWTNEAFSATMPTNLFATFTNVPPPASMKFFRAHAM